jgi:acetaldehyde dehydrogenase / alcohol dehydrogenase
MHAAIAEVLAPPADDSGRAGAMVQRAVWAGSAFRRLDRSAVDRIVHATAEAAHAEAGRFAEWAVRETGFGVVEHKRKKNELTSRGLYEHYREHDLVTRRVRAADGIVEIPRPAGVVLALTPSTNPISTVNFKVLLALMTRNAVIVSPHPAARECSIEAVHVMAKAAEAAGAPAGSVQVVERPSIPAIEFLMRHPEVDVIVATGGTAVVRAAYGSGNPAIGVGPGNAPVLVDDSADPDRAARLILDSKSFDNSVLCTNESVLVTTRSAAPALEKALRRHGGHVCSPEERDRLRNHLFRDGSFNVAALGKPARWIAEQAGISCDARVLLAPIDRVGIEEPLSREKLCPVLGYLVETGIEPAIAASRALIRSSGAGHSAAIHSRDPGIVMAFAHAVAALRVVVDSPCSLGAAGYGTSLAPSFTIGTGFVGRSSLGDNLQPDHLVNWTRIAYPAGEPMPDFESVELPAATPPPSEEVATLREEIRRLVREELRAALGGS